MITPTDAISEITTDSDPSMEDNTLTPCANTGAATDALLPDIVQESEQTWKPSPKGLQPNSGADHEIILFSADATRSDKIRQLTSKIPANDYGLPAYYIRSDYLDLNQTMLTQEDIDLASVVLEYDMGYPTLPEGSSFWNRLPHEPRDAYASFQHFLEQAELQGIRQLDVLAQSINATAETMQRQYHEYFWSSRARAYDLFVVAANRKKQEFRRRSMENNHYESAQRLLTKLAERFDDPEWIEELTAKDAIEAMETLVKIQRLSTGLTGQHASSMANEQTPPGASAELILRQVSEVNGSNVSGSQGVPMIDKLRALTEDPEHGMRLQETILKITAPSNVQSFSEGV